MSSFTNPTIKLNNGQLMPLLGLGTSKSSHVELVEAVKFAIDRGYRLFDCAWRYNNLKAVGEGIRAKIAEGKVKREELFVTSKLWRSFHRGEHMDECMDLTLRDLGLPYVDLFLMHFPEASAYAGVDEYERLDANGRVVIDQVHYTEVWRNMQRFVADGRARMLGVSNFNRYQIDKLLDECESVPVVNQIEVHPYLANCELVEHCQSKGIAVTAFCSIGTTDRARFFACATFPLLLEDKTLRAIAEKHGKSPAQVALRFCLERDIAVIPKSVTPSRIGENMDVFNFRLDRDDLDALFGMNRDHRFMTSLQSSHHRLYPFRSDYTED